METFSVINLMPSQKEEVSLFANDIVNRIKNNDIDVITFYDKKHWIELCLKEIEKQTKEKWFEKISKEGAVYVSNGLKKTAMESGTTYDYSADAEWVALKEKIKERETFLKSLKEPLEVVNTETGETTTLVPPVKRSTSTYKFTAI
jgi:hypothetical protein